MTKKICCSDNGRMTMRRFSPTNGIRFISRRFLLSTRWQKVSAWTKRVLEELIWQMQRKDIESGNAVCFKVFFVIIREQITFTRSIRKKIHKFRQIFLTNFTIFMRFARRN